MRLELFYLACWYGATRPPRGVREPFLEKLQAKLKHTVLDLIKDTSYEGAENLRDCLGSLEQRRDWLSRLFTRKEAAQLTADLQSTVTTLQERIDGFERYMEGVHQRLGRFSETFPRDSWGFAFGVDHEDLVDERNEDMRSREQYRAASAASMRLKALQTAFDVKREPRI